LIKKNNRNKKRSRNKREGVWKLHQLVRFRLTKNVDLDLMGMVADVLNRYAR